MKVKDAADMEKYPIVCRSKNDCKMLMPERTPNNYCLIPLRKVDGMLEFDPKDRYQTILTVYRLSRAYLYEAAHRYAKMIEFEDGFSLRDLNLLRAILESKINNPEYSSMVVQILYRAMGHLKLDDKTKLDCKRRPREECNFIDSLPTLAKQVIEKYRGHLNNLDEAFTVPDADYFYLVNSLEDFSHGDWSKVSSHFQSETFQKCLALPRLNIPLLEYHLSEEEKNLPSLNRDEQERLAENIEADQGCKFDDTTPLRNVFEDSLLMGAAEHKRLHRETAAMFANIHNKNDVTVVEIDDQAQSRKAKVIIGGPTSRSKLFIELLTKSFVPNLKLLLVNRLSKTSQETSQSSLALPDYSLKKILQSNDIAAEMEGVGKELEKTKDSIKKVWGACLAANELEVIGKDYSTWLLLSKGTIDELVQKINVCIASQDLTCVRRKLKCPDLEDQFLNHVLHYMRLAFIQQYYEERFQKLTDEEQKFEIDNAANQLGTGRLLTWQFANKKVLTEVQYKSVEMALEPGFPEIILQRVMASGKTSTLGPLITHGKADGWHLPVLIVPTALFETNSADLLRRQLLFFGQRGMALRFERIYDFNNYDHLVDLLRQMVTLISERGYIVCAPEAIQAMENSFIEMLDPALKVPQLTFDAMRMILRLLRSRGLATIDEIDTIFNPKKDLNYPIGAMAAIGETYIYMSALLQYIAHRSPKGDSKFLLDQFKLLAKHEPWKEVLSSLAEFDEAFLLASPRSELVPDKGIKSDHYLIMWQQLHRWIPECQKSVVNLNFGRSVKYPEYWLAKPFKAAKVPSEESEFSYPYETLNKTFAMYFSLGIDAAQLESFFWYALGNAKDLVSTKSLFGITGAINLKDKKPLVDSFNNYLLKSEGNMHQLALTTLLNYLARVAIPRDLQYYPKSINSNAFSMASRFNRLMGYSGTLPNDFVFPERLRKGLYKEDDAIQNILNRIGQMSHVRAGLEKYENLTEKVSVIAGECKSSALALIDIGALFKDSSNTEVAAELLDQWQHVKAILFYHPTTNKIVGMKRDENGQPDDKNLIPTFGMEESKILTALNLTEGDRYAIFLDQWHTTGTDIPLPRNAHGIATIGVKTTTRDLTQGVMRMRKFLRGQTVEFFLDRAVAQAIPELSPQHIVNYAEHVAKAVIQKENLQVAFAKLKNEVRASILDSILSHGMLSTDWLYYNYPTISPFLVTSEGSISEMYGCKLVNEDADKYLLRSGDWLIEQIQPLVSSGLADAHLVERLQEIIESIKAVSLETPIMVSEAPLAMSREGTEQQKVNLQTQLQEDLLEEEGEVGSQKDKDALASYQSIPECIVSFDFDLEMVVDPDCQVVAKRLRLNSLRLRDIVSEIVPNVDCIDPSIHVTHDFALVRKGEKGRPELGIWKPFQKPVEALLWIDNGKDQQLIVCSANDAARFAEKNKPSTNPNYQKQMALIDLKGTIMASSNSQVGACGTKIEHPELKKLLRDVAILFGSYPLMRQADNIEDSETNMACFAHILRYSLKGRHRIAFLNDPKVFSKFHIEVDKSGKVPDFKTSKGLEKPEVKKLGQIEGPVNLCTPFKFMDFIHSDLQLGVTEGPVTWSSISLILMVMRSRIVSDRRIKTLQVRALCTRILEKAEKALGNPAVTPEAVKDRVDIRLTIQHVINILDFVDFLDLGEDLPICPRLKTAARA